MEGNLCIFYFRLLISPGTQFAFGELPHLLHESAHLPGIRSFINKNLQIKMCPLWYLRSRNDVYFPVCGRRVIILPTIFMFHFYAHLKLKSLSRCTSGCYQDRCGKPEFNCLFRVNLRIIWQSNVQFSLLGSRQREMGLYECTSQVNSINPFLALLSSDVDIDFIGSKIFFR